MRRPGGAKHRRNAAGLNVERPVLPGPDPHVRGKRQRGPRPAVGVAFGAQLGHQRDALDRTERGRHAQPQQLQRAAFVVGVVELPVIVWGNRGGDVAAQGQPATGQRHRLLGQQLRRGDGRARQRQCQRQPTDASKPPAGGHGDTDTLPNPGGGRWRRVIIRVTECRSAGYGCRVPTSARTSQRRHPELDHHRPLHDAGQRGDPGRATPACRRGAGRPATSEPRTTVTRLPLKRRASRARS